MKNNIYSTLLVCLLFLLGTTSHAQQKKGNLNNGKNKSKIVKIEQNVNNNVYESKKNDNSKSNGKAYAYGKNKGGLQGREFGQERARQARLNNKQKINKTNKGHAYGKNKGGLQGREFGQERARQARLNNNEEELDDD